MKTNLKNFPNCALSPESCSSCPFHANFTCILQKWKVDFEAELQEMRDKSANISKMIVYT